MQRLDVLDRDATMSVVEVNMTVRAIYENGVFRPTELVNLPEKSQVEVLLPPLPAEGDQLDAVYRIMGESYESGESDVAERHNEHQP